MSEKIEALKKEINNKTSCDVLTQIEKKIEFFKDVIQKTIIHVHQNKLFDILGINDVDNCIERLGLLSKKIQQISPINNNDSDILINNLQIINNDLSVLLKNYGTSNFEDLLLICFGNNTKITTTVQEHDKMELLKKYFHPTSYKVINKNEVVSKHHNLALIEDINSNLSCSEVASICTQFHMKVNGIKIQIYSTNLKKNLIIYGIVDDVIIDYLNNKFILNKIQKIREIFSSQPEFHQKEETFNNFLSSLTLKDFLMNDNENDIYVNFIESINQNNDLTQKQIAQTVKDFISSNLFQKRNTLINLLICSINYENQYLAYLLYDLLSNDFNESVDTQDQTMIFDSFPWPIKQHFKQAMKKTIQYTNELSNFDINKIPLEQQICLLKASNSVKENAMMKLKEVKSKSEDSGSKPRQYLDGLLKIPFGIYYKEPILNMMEKIRTQFKNIFTQKSINNTFNEIPFKEKYTSVEVLKYIKKIQNILTTTEKEQIEQIKKYLFSGDKKQICSNVSIINDLLIKHKNNKIKFQSLNKEQLKEEIEKFIELCKTPENDELFNETIEYFVKHCDITNVFNTSNVKTEISTIRNNLTQITEYLTEVKATLDKAVYGHDKAKKQIERIIGQWINGEQDGYCFGFEGPPGVGKTSLSKYGLSNCLKDDKGNGRPFAMIQMGGDVNGCTLNGHNYTYVGSTWGAIVQILIDKKCMNPIIFIDEVDKISQTEHGKEIFGILTHLLDPTQNDCFQDKYFSGIDLDLSKALFVLSYNDVNAIDKILLDRIHRIKFNSLSFEDKLVICKTHILPDIYKKMGLEDIIQFKDPVLKFIIEEYTLESGVRKLKEILFEIVGEINLDILKNNTTDYDFPINITIDDVKNKFFKDKREIIIRKVPEVSMVGFANGMYATTSGSGGTLPIHAKFFPSEHFLELKLTGLQQDVMRESMHVSLTVAWNLTSEDRKKHLRKIYDGENNKYGINIHPGDGSTQKDGPSAGGIITLVLYSLLNDIPIKAQMAMTGEIQMSGDITAIGGLNHKILGSIKAGVTQFIYPKENKKDFDEFYEKYKNDELLNNIKFYEVNHINEALELILEK
jgi:ATP-dependent Lon protease